MGSLMSMAILTLLAFHYSQLMEAKPLPTTFCASLALVANQGAGDKIRRSLDTLNGHKDARRDYSALLGAYEECLRASEGIRFKKGVTTGHHFESEEPQPQNDYSGFWAHLKTLGKA